MTRLRAFNRWVWQTVDWRYIASLAAAGFVAVIIATLVTQADARHDADRRAAAAIDAQLDSREAATRRIDMLSQQVESLTGEVINLREMLLAAGVDPPPRPTTTTVRRRPTTSTTVRRAPPPTTTTQRPAPTTTAPPATTTSQPPPTTTTTAPCAVSIPGVCL